MNAREFILSHADPNYDPRKRREYYLRTRQLKGREPGAGRPPSAPSGRPNLNLSTEKERRERVEALQRKLDRLKEIYQELLAQSKGRAGIESPSKTPAKKASSSKGGSSSTKTTAKERREAAERSKEWREKHPKKKSQPEKSVEEKLASLRKAIAKIRAEIAAAKKKQARRDANSSATVTPNPSATGR